VTGRWRSRRAARGGAVRKHELTLSFDELMLIYKSLQAAKTLGALPPEDELLDDTIQVVDQALDIALTGPADEQFAVRRTPRKSERHERRRTA
jgi:hypothetical protein